VVQSVDVLVKFLSCSSKSFAKIPGLFVFYGSYMFIYVHICSYMFIYVHIRSYTFIYVHNYTLSSHHHLTSVSSRLSSPKKGVKYVVFLGNNGICCCCCSSPFWLSPSSTQSNQISICCSSSFEKHSPKQNPSYSNFSSLAKGPKKIAAENPGAVWDPQHLGPRVKLGLKSRLTPGFLSRLEHIITCHICMYIYIYIW